MTGMQTCLWFDGNARDAADFYAATFPDSRVDAIHAAPTDASGVAAGAPLVVAFTLLGMACIGLNAGPAFRFTEAISFQLLTDDQAETDRYWHAIIADGGQPGDCGWCKDRFGLSWQVTPRMLLAAITDPDRAAAARAMQAMMTMTKIDIAAIAAAHGGTA